MIKDQKEERERKDTKMLSKPIRAFIEGQDGDEIGC